MYRSGEGAGGHPRSELLVTTGREGESSARMINGMENKSDTIREQLSDTLHQQVKFQ